MKNIYNILQTLKLKFKQFYCIKFNLTNSYVIVNNFSIDFVSLIVNYRVNYLLIDFFYTSYNSNEDDSFVLLFLI